MTTERRPSTSSRRELLRRAADSAALALTATLLPSRSAAAAEEEPRTSGASGEPPALRKLSERLAVYEGPINVGVIRDGDTALLIDCGDASLTGRLARLGIKTVARVVFTHHHRDQACGAAELAASGARLAGPAAERAWFEDVEGYWNNPKHRWGVYNFHPHRLMLAEPVKLDAVYADGDEFRWGPAAIRAIATPGHTDGSMSYLVEVDGRRVAFCGDAIYDAGRLWELYSLQKGTQTSDYHGFLGARQQLVESLERLVATKCDTLVPSHGRVIDAPADAVAALVKRLDACYDKYVAISALRHYFPKLFTAYADRKDHMPFSEGRQPPECLHHFGTTWVLVAQNGAALMMDCGSTRAIDEVKKLIDQGTIKKVEGLWVTHYHNDHTEQIPAALEAFGCPCIADASVARVIREPLAWRLPCVSKKAIPVERACAHGDSWSWHEWKLTSYYLPGQTLYHGALLADNGTLRMLFIGDSFTPAGIDDYCAQNRNWLGRGVGFDNCLELIERLKPTHLFNPHVNVAWQFSAEQIAFMRANLAERERLFGELFPWDHANYGMDEWWIRPHPYEQVVKPGQEAKFAVVVTNHSPGAQTARCRAVAPRAWCAEGASLAARVTEWQSASIPAKKERPLPMAIRVPSNAPRGRYVVGIDVEYADRRMPQFSEAVVVVEPE